jgi:glyoxalase family protein
MKLAGIHHVTAIASEPAANAAFYTEVLGMRLVKKTVNFDDPPFCCVRRDSSSYCR